MACVQHGPLPGVRRPLDLHPAIPHDKRYPIPSFRSSCVALAALTGTRISQSSISKHRRILLLHQAWRCAVQSCGKLRRSFFFVETLPKPWIAPGYMSPRPAPKNPSLEGFSICPAFKYEPKAEPRWFAVVIVVVMNHYATLRYAHDCTHRQLQNNAKFVSVPRARLHAAGLLWGTGTPLHLGISTAAVFSDINKPCLNTYYL